MVNSRQPVGGRHLRARRRPILITVGIATLLAIPSAVSAYWNVGGFGTAVVRTGTLDVAGTKPMLRASGQDVLVSWEQSRLVERWLGTYRAGGYKVRRYDAAGRSREVRTACSGTMAGLGAAVRCVEHGVPQGTWAYAVTPLLGGWTGREGPRGVVTVHAPQANDPADGGVAGDTTAPITADDTAAVGAEWKRADQTVALRAADPHGSGVAATYFTTDGSTPTTASAQGVSVRIGEGVHVIRYYSVDRAGNSEAVRTAATPIQVDETAPSAPTLGPLPEVVRDGQVLTGGGDDALSGVVRVTYEFCVDAACDSWTPIGSSTTGPAYALAWRDQPSDGRYRLRANVLDAAGNAAASTSWTVRVDNTSPSATTVMGIAPAAARQVAHYSPA